MTALATTLQAFFTDRLIRQRQASPHTLSAYRDTLRLLLVFASNAIYLIPLFALVSFGVLLSTATHNSAAAVVGTIGLVILLFIVAQIPGLEGIQPYLLTEQFQAWQGLLRTPTDWEPIVRAAWVCALYGIPTIAAAFLVFIRRDVAGG